MLARRAFLAGLCGTIAVGAAGAQSVVGLPIVVLDRDRLYAESRFGKRVQLELEVAGRALAAENRRIEAALEAEERVLTEQRATTDPVAFRELANEFDERVEAIRQAQSTKTRSLTQSIERAQQLFFDTAGPILADLAREVGALVVLDRRQVLASAERIDITQRALERIDEELGDGPGLEGVALAPPAEVAPTARPTEIPETPRPDGPLPSAQ